MKENTINVSELFTKYVDEDRIKEGICFHMWCNKKANYVRILTDGFPIKRRVYHCKSHSSKEHKRIIFGK